MKKILDNKSKFLFFSFVLGILFPLIGFSQAPSGIIWDKFVGCQKADAEYEYVFTVEDTGFCLKLCEGSLVNYQLVGGIPAQWSQVDINVSGGQLVSTPSTTDFSIQWGSTGWGSISVDILTLNGETFREYLCIEKIPKPEVFFNIAPALNDPNNYNPHTISVCKDEIIYFQNFSKTAGGSPLISHEWIIDGPTGIDYLYDFEPAYTFTESGQYSVTLKVTNACNCSESTSVIFEVLEMGLQILCNSVVCENTVETYSISMIPNEENPEVDELNCIQYIWQVEGGTIVSQNGDTVQVKWDNIDDDGFGYLSFIPEGCDVVCNQPVTIKVPVIKNNIENGPDEICQGQQVRYSIPKWPTTEVKWKIQGSGAQLISSDQNNEIILEARMPGTYFLTANYTNTLLGCSGTATKEITIIPSVSIQGTKLVCQNTMGSYNLSNNASADWLVKGPMGFTYSFSGTQLDLQFPELGSYTIAAEGDFCIEEAFIVQVYSIPNAPTSIDGPLEVCIDSPNRFSVPDIPSGANTFWEIENGEIISGNYTKEISVKFDNNPTGPYKIRARNQTDQCFSDWTEITVEAVVVDLQISGDQIVCSSTYVNYSVNETLGDKYKWSISPDYLGSVVDAKHKDEIEILWNNVNTPTLATIELEVEKCGQVFIETYQVTVQQTPDISITGPATVCREEPVNFGIQTPGGLTSWSSIEWDFGDGNTASNTTNPSHTYTDLNTGQVNYVVTVSVNEPNGCLGTSTASFSINVIPAPVAYISPATADSYCELADLLADAPSFNLVLDTNYPNPTTINWYNELNNQNVNQYYNAVTGEFSPMDFGQYYAIIDGVNCSTKTNTIKIEKDDCGNDPGCDIPATITDVTAQLTGCGTVSLTASYIGNLTSFQWIASNSTILNQTATSAEIEFNQAGVHSIEYKAIFEGIDNYGNPCTKEISKRVQILVPYKAGVSYSVSCSSTPDMYDLTIFDTSSYVTGTTVPNANFYLNNTQVGTGSGPITIPVSPGQHTIEVQISSPGSFVCTDSVSIDLEVKCLYLLVHKISALNY